MAFCPKCGKQMPDDARFCSGCGSPLVVAAAQATGRRTTVWAGAVRKCPNCGATLPTLVAECPSCGYELRKADSSDSLQALTARLADIDATPLKGTPEGDRDRKADRKATLVRNYVIPNNKADIFEFLMVAESNVDFEALANPEGGLSPSRQALNRAWDEKYEQAFQKATLLFSDDPEFQLIRKAYDSHRRRKATSGDKGRSRDVVRRSVPLVLGVGLVVAGLVITSSSSLGAVIMLLGFVLLIVSAASLGKTRGGTDEIVLNVVGDLGVIALGGFASSQGRSGDGGVMLLFGAIALIVSVVKTVRLTTKGN